MTVYRGSSEPGATERELRGMIALSDEQTIQQDPAFAIRIMVDIALMALSPAVNAPTTATQVSGHLGETLRMFGATDLGRAGSAPVTIRPPSSSAPRSGRTTSRSGSPRSVCMGPPVSR